MATNNTQVKKKWKTVKMNVLELTQQLQSVFNQHS